MGFRRHGLARRRKAVGYTQEQLAERLGVERSTVVRWERGETEPQPWSRPKLARVLGVSVDDLEALLRAEDRAHSREQLPSIESLRRELDDALTISTIPPSSVDDWERTVLEHGQATRDQPTRTLLVDLTADLAELKQALGRCRSALALRRLTRVTALMSGLIALELCKRDERTAFRRWAQTARLAATEVDDVLTHSWIRAQEAYGYYYSGDFTEAIAVARHAQGLANRTPSVGAVLAAALEARAQARLGRRSEMKSALGRAEVGLSRLPPEALTASAFGYTESQLRFHEGNALTHLGDTRAAWRAQERALALCPQDDYMDRTMIELDRATCLAQDGDASEAAQYAMHTLTSLSHEQRQGIIMLRAGQLVKALPARHRELSPARELTDLVMSQQRKGE